MTKDQKFNFTIARSCRDEHLRECAAAALAGNLPKAQEHAEMARLHEGDMVKVVTSVHCGDCGAHESEPCSPTCGYDGPTASDAMADGSAHAD